ncbi:hypothetical protein MT390_02340 [Vibrio sp. 2-Bac 85]
MKIVLLLCLSFLILGCSNIVMSGAIVEAQNAFNMNKYNKAIENIDIAESFGDLSEANVVKLQYLRAQSLDALGRQEEATLIYEYLVDQYPRSAYARSSLQRLNAPRIFFKY